MRYQRPKINLQTGQLAKEGESVLHTVHVEVWQNDKGWRPRRAVLPKHLVDILNLHGIMRMTDEDSDEIAVRLPRRRKRTNRRG